MNGSDVIAGLNRTLDSSAGENLFCFTNIDDGSACVLAWSLVLTMLLLSIIVWAILLVLSFLYYFMTTRCLRLVSEDPARSLVYGCRSLWKSPYQRLLWRLFLQYIPSLIATIAFVNSAFERTVSDFTVGLLSVCNFCFVASFLARWAAADDKGAALVSKYTIIDAFNGSSFLAMLLLECDFRAEDIQIIGADCVDSSTGIIARTWFSLSFLRILYVSKLFDDIEQCHRSGWASRSIAWQLGRFAAKVCAVLFVWSCFVFVLELLGDLSEVDSSPFFRLGACPNGFVDFDGSADCEKTEVLSIFSSIYFIFVTASTVGYGDFSPATSMSRILIILLIVSGVIAFSVQTSKLIAIFQRDVFGERAYDVFNDGVHVVVTGSPSLTQIQDFLREFYHPEHDPLNRLTTVFLLSNPAPEIRSYLAERGQRTNRRLFFINGSPLEHADLQRAGLEYAETIFFMPNKFASDRLTEDSATLISVLSVRRYLESHSIEYPPFKARLSSAIDLAGFGCFMRFDTRKKRKRQVARINDALKDLEEQEIRPQFPQISAMLLLAEHRQHLITAGVAPCNIVGVDELKYSLLGASTTCFALSTLVANLVVSRDSIPAVTDNPWTVEYRRGAGKEFYSFVLLPRFVGKPFVELASTIFRRSRGSVQLLGFETRTSTGSPGGSVRGRAGQATAYKSFWAAINAFKDQANRSDGSAPPMLVPDRNSRLEPRSLAFCLADNPDALLPFADPLQVMGPMTDLRDDASPRTQAADATKHRLNVVGKMLSRRRTAKASRAAEKAADAAEFQRWRAMRYIATTGIQAAQLQTCRADRLESLLVRASSTKSPSKRRASQAGDGDEKKPSLRKRLAQRMSKGPATSRSEALLQWRPRKDSPSRGSRRVIYPSATELMTMEMASHLNLPPPSPPSSSLLNKGGHILLLCGPTVPYTGLIHLLETLRKRPHPPPLVILHDRLPDESEWYALTSHKFGTPTLSISIILGTMTHYHELIRAGVHTASRVVILASARRADTASHVNDDRIADAGALLSVQLLRSKLGAYLPPLLVELTYNHSVDFLHFSAGFKGTTQDEQLGSALRIEVPVRSDDDSSARQDAQRHAMLVPDANHTLRYASQDTWTQLRASVAARADKHASQTLLHLDSLHKQITRAKRPSNSDTTNTPAAIPEGEQVTTTASNTNATATTTSSATGVTAGGNGAVSSTAERVAASVKRNDEEDDDNDDDSMSSHSSMEDDVDAVYAEQITPEQITEKSRGSEFFTLPEFASGLLYTSSLAESLLASAFYQPHVSLLVREIVASRHTTVELVSAPTCLLKHNEARRHSSAVAGDSSYLSDNVATADSVGGINASQPRWSWADAPTFGDVYHYYMQYGMAAIGILRNGAHFKMIPANRRTSKRRGAKPMCYVVTAPSADAKIGMHDQLYLLVNCFDECYRAICMLQRWVRHTFGDKTPAKSRAQLHRSSSAMAVQRGQHRLPLQSSTNPRRPSITLRREQSLPAMQHLLQANPGLMRETLGTASNVSDSEESSRPSSASPAVAATDCDDVPVVVHSVESTGRDDRDQTDDSVEATASPQAPRHTPTDSYDCTDACEEGSFEENQTRHRRMSSGGDSAGHVDGGDTFPMHTNSDPSHARIVPPNVAGFALGRLGFAAEDAARNNSR